MILEVAVLNIKPGEGAKFEHAFAIAQEILAAMPGYLEHECRRCLEVDDQYILLVRWESLEAHTTGFRKSPRYQEWRELLHHFYEPFPEVLHYETLPGLRSADSAN